LAGIDLSQRSIREQIGSAFDLVVQIKRLQDGSRRIVSIAEITGVQEGVISMQELFEYRQDGLNSCKQVMGEHVACGLRPYHESKFKEASIELQSDLFAPVGAHVGLRRPCESRKAASLPLARPPGKDRSSR